MPNGFGVYSAGSGYFHGGLSLQECVLPLIILRAIGLEPAAMEHRLKMLLLTRLIPFVEKNYNFIELGPRGTGKFHAYSEMSPYCILISGGKASAANLFYNNARRQVGLVGYWDVVAFDEVGGMKGANAETIQIMKDYMANGRFSRGVTQVIADASMVFVGNLNQPVETLVQNSAADLFQPLPAEFDLASTAVSGVCAPKRTAPSRWRSSTTSSRRRGASTPSGRIGEAHC